MNNMKKTKQTNHEFDLFRFNNMSIINGIKGINIGIKGGQAWLQVGLCQRLLHHG
jgi:hypothetical protein